MIWLMKFLHFAALVFGSGASIGTLYLLLNLNSFEGPPPLIVQRLRKWFMVTALIAIVTLWMSGYLLWSWVYSQAALGGAFHVKLLFASVLLLVVVAINVLAQIATRTGTKPPSLMNALGFSTSVFLLFTVLFATLTFS